MGRIGLKSSRAGKLTDEPMCQRRPGISTLRTEFDPGDGRPVSTFTGHSGSGEGHRGWGNSCHFVAARRSPGCTQGHLEIDLYQRGQDHRHGLGTDRRDDGWPRSSGSRAADARPGWARSSGRGRRTGVPRGPRRRRVFDPRSRRTSCGSCAASCPLFAERGRREGAPILGIQAPGAA